MRKDVKASETGANAKRDDAEEMIELFRNMTELERARVFGYAQGIESITQKAAECRAG